ncbi:MAG: thioredoxin family protein [Prevotellaceae bacterium]|jgi:thiol-disulfide isomerase/thioredoxin|nr:thioredoxin family protein [Prevotellaceae bacterium]
MKKAFITAIILFCICSVSTFAQLKELNQNELYEKVLTVYDKGDYTYKNKPSIVLFYSPYCPYSKEMEKTLKKVSGNYEDRINFYKVNVFKIDDYTMENLEIEGTPTIGVDDGEEFLCNGGMATKQDLEELCQDLIEFYYE